MSPNSTTILFSILLFHLWESYFFSIGRENLASGLIKTFSFFLDSPETNRPVPPTQKNERKNIKRQEKMSFGITPFLNLPSPKKRKQKILRGLTWLFFFSGNSKDNKNLSGAFFIFILLNGMDGKVTVNIFLMQSAMKFHW